MEHGLEALLRHVQERTQPRHVHSQHRPLPTQVEVRRTRYSISNPQLDSLFVVNRNFFVHSFFFPLTFQISIGKLEQALSFSLFFSIRNDHAN